MLGFVSTDNESLVRARATRTAPSRPITNCCGAAKTPGGTIYQRTIPRVPR